MHCAIYGHSFVKRLNNHLNKNSVKKLVNIACKLRVNKYFERVVAIGKTGATVMNTSHESIARSLKYKEVDLLILDIGANDLDNGVPPLNVAVKLIDL